MHFLTSKLQEEVVCSPLLLLLLFLLQIHLLLAFLSSFFTNRFHFFSLHLPFPSTYNYFLYPSLVYSSLSFLL
jgi:hypothetical protein